MRFTIAIATWNRADLLAQTLQSLASLSVPDGSQWEVVVCDNNSSDQTKATVEQIMAKGELNTIAGFSGMRYLFEPTQGKSHALNHILREARGKWVLFLDDDVLVEPAWLCEMSAAMVAHPNAAILGGPILPRLYRKVSARESFLLKHYPGAYGITEVASDTPIADPHPTPGGANMAVKREVALAIGFDKTRGMFAGQRVAGEDVTMAMRIIAAGHEGWLIAGARVLHHTPSDCLGGRRLFRWQAGIGRTWILERGKPQPGKFGIAWWAWREMIRRTLKTCLRWRPWPTRSYYDALIDMAQYWGYLRAK